MPPLVLLPGMNCTADLWTGCGLDDAISAPLGEASIDAQVDRLLEDLPAVFVLGGLSLGAIVAMALALRAPERVAGLCLVSTNSKGPKPAQRESWQRWLIRMDAGESPRQLQLSILESLLSPRVRATRPDLVERTLAMADATGATTLRAQLALQQTRTDLRAGLKRLRVQTLVVSGADDAICPPSFHSEIVSDIPHSRLVSLPGGHLLPVERPEIFGALVRDWRAEIA